MDYLSMIPALVNMVLKRVNLNKNIIGLDVVNILYIVKRCCFLDCYTVVIGVSWLIFTHTQLTFYIVITHLFVCHLLLWRQH